MSKSEKQKLKLIRHEPVNAYALAVGGEVPYLSTIGRTYSGARDGEIVKRAVEAECTRPYHKCVPAVMLTLADYRRLVKAAKVAG